MHASGLVETRGMAVDGARPRKNYTVTAAGRESPAHVAAAWRAISPGAGDQLRGAAAMNGSTLSAEAEQYLAELGVALAAVAPAERETILDDLRSHIAGALDQGQRLPGPRDRLGAPDAVAAAAQTEPAAELFASLPAPDPAVGQARCSLLLAAASAGALTAARLTGGLYLTVALSGRLAGRR